MKRRKGLALLLGAAVTGAALSQSVIFSNATDLQSSKNTTIGTVELTSSGTEFSYSNIADVAEAVMPSIVAITNKSVQEVRSFFYGQPLQYESTSAGSGIIMGTNDTELLICSNNHVVEDASELTVSFIDEESYPAIVKGTDASNDLAVVAVKLEDISKDTMDQIKVAKIGSSDDMRVGEQVVAIGNALGYGQSVTTGIVSAKNRSIGIANEDDNYRRRFEYGYGLQTEDAETTYDDLLQTDAAINPGNSGGALLNMNGEVIGINSAKASSNGVEGMGYAIPVDKAMPILNELMNRATREKLDEGKYGYVGITGQSVSAEATFLYGIPEGLYVTSVSQGSPAEAAGLKEGDIITSFDNVTITGMEDLQANLQYYAPGEEVDMKVYTQAGNHMGYEEETLIVTLGDRKDLQ